MAHRILHAGCGGEPLPYWLKGEETRLDIDPAARPDIVASMTAMGEIGPFDVVYCSHALEHVFPHEVPLVLGEFYRVLAPGGVVIVFVPDIEDVPPTDKILYESPGGPIAGLDLLYGHRASLRERPYMAHHTGFIGITLAAALRTAGFEKVKAERLSNWNLLGVGAKPG